MSSWQADFYKCFSESEQASPQWLLIVSDSQGNIIHESQCPQSQANASWIVSQLQPIISKNSPDIIQVFRPQSIGLLTVACQELGVRLEANRRTPELKKILKQKAHSNYHNPVKLEQPPPQALPENLWGEGWRVGTVKAGDIVDFFGDRPIPIVDTPSLLLPINLGIPSTVPIPGIIIYGGRKSMHLARWLEEIKPVTLNYIPTKAGESGGLVLESGLVDRWILATFEDEEMSQAAQNYESQKKESQGLHFLIIQPDDSGVTYSGFWLLREEEI